jgi:hypothetical protein
LNQSVHVCTTENTPFVTPLSRIRSAARALSEFNLPDQPLNVHSTACCPARRLFCSTQYLHLSALLAHNCFIFCGSTYKQILHFTNTKPPSRSSKIRNTLKHCVQMQPKSISINLHFSHAYSIFPMLIDVFNHNLASASSALLRAIPF